MLIPAPAKASLPVFKSATSVQLTPFHSSVLSVGVGGELAPPKTNAASLSGPDPAQFCLHVFTLFTSVQFVPFHNSLIADDPGSPPTDKAEVLVPTPAI